MPNARGQDFLAALKYFERSLNEGKNHPDHWCSHARIALFAGEDKKKFYNFFMDWDTVVRSTTPNKSKYLNKSKTKAPK
jgi:hypothetical protein